MNVSEMDDIRTHDVSLDAVAESDGEPVAMTNAGNAALRSIGSSATA